MRPPTERAISESWNLLNKIPNVRVDFADLVLLKRGEVVPDESHYLSHRVTDLVKMWKEKPQNIPPIVVDENNKIIDGHHRFAAAGKAKVPAMYVLRGSIR